MLPYKIHKFDGKEFDLAKQIPAYLIYCDYDYCWQEYNNDRIPIPIQTFFRFSEPAYLKDGYYRRYYNKYDLERTRNYRYFKNRDVLVSDIYKTLSDNSEFRPELPNYTRGFLEGYKFDFIPFIDTPQAQIEMIVQAAKVRPEFMSTQTKDDKPVRFSDVYSQGLFEGKRYKAWSIIEQTPNVFVSYFINTVKTDQQAVENKTAKPDTTLPPKPLAGLLKELNDEQLDNLFIFLTTKNNAYSKPQFIDKETTDRDSFNHIFGGKDIQNPVIPIEWKANNQWLREIFARLQTEQKYHSRQDGTKTIVLSNEIERQVEQYFTKKNIKINIRSSKQMQDKPEYKAINIFLATL